MTAVANGQKQNAKQPNGTVKWPSHARIVPPAFGGTIRLTDQDPLVNHVIMGAIADLTKSCFFESAWPNNTETGEWRRARLLASANRSIEQFPQLTAFVSRLHADISFGYSLGALVSLFYPYQPINATKPFSQRSLTDLQRCVHPQKRRLKRSSGTTNLDLAANAKLESPPWSPRSHLFFLGCGTAM